MILARAISADRPEDLDLAFARMALPPSAREYLLEKVPHTQLLLTGLEKAHGRFLRDRSQASVAPGREEYPQYIAGDVRHRPGAGLLSGRKEQLERLAEEAALQPELSPLAAALRRVLSVGRPADLVISGVPLKLSERAHVMGVVNVTPDSFSDGGRFLDPERAIAHGLALAEAGADLLDVGGESTRPGAPPVSPEDELARILPVIRGLAARTRVPLSVDTTKAAVAEAALDAGAGLVNDVSGLSFDPGLAAVIASKRAACCVMHLRGTPATMQQDPRYDDVVEEVLGFLDGAVARAEAAGIDRAQLLVDPGIGFGKTAGHNLVLLRRLADLRQLGTGVLVGPSRKAFLGAVTGGRPVGERLAATLGAAATVVALGGADVVRVHDAREARDALAVAQAVRDAREAGALFERPARLATDPGPHFHG